jgi:hypothetical protein
MDPDSFGDDNSLSSADSFGDDDSVSSANSFGDLMLGETIMLPGLFGIALLTIGIGLVATDPGEKVAGH